MKSDISIDPKRFTAAFFAFIHRYHIIIFACIVLGGLAAATFTLYETAMSAQSVTQKRSQTTFDPATIKKIENLRYSTEAESSLVLPEGRTNPFEEGS